MGERPVSAQLALLVIATGAAGIAALFAILGFLRAQQVPDALTAPGATQILRAETEIVRSTVADQARGLRQELGQSLKGFQELTLAAFGTLRDGIDAQVRGFGERLDGGIKAIDERAAAISIKLNDEMAQMRAEANTNRETLRTLIEQKLDHSVSQQADASKILRDELSGNFHRLTEQRLEVPRNSMKPLTPLKYQQGSGYGEKEVPKCSTRNRRFLSARLIISEQLGSVEISSLR